MGNLCVLDPASGGATDRTEGRFVDVISSRTHRGTVLASAWKEDGGGQLSTFAHHEGRLYLRAREPLHFEDTRLLNANPLVGLGSNEGTTLFVGVEGRGIFGTSSFLVRGDDHRLDLWLLERARKHPQLARLRWDSALREIDRRPTDTPRFACVPRLVRNAPQTWLTGVHDGDLIVQSSDGSSSVRRHDAAASDACVEDAVWLDGSDQVAVVTGPEARVHLVSIRSSDVGQSLALGHSLWHDPRPHRRLAYDPARRRLWIALSDELGVLGHLPDGRLGPAPNTVPACPAESVTLLW